MLRRLFRGRDESGQPTLVVTDDLVQETLPDGSVDIVRWDELSQVSVVTTADGPVAEDLFWVLLGRGESGCTIPQSAASDELVRRIQRLPGFDNGA